MHKPLLVDLTVEEGQRLKVIYGSLSGFHAIDVDSGTPYDLYLPTHVRRLMFNVGHLVCKCFLCFAAESFHAYSCKAVAPKGLLVLK